MILFADGNTANSLQSVVGPTWQIFLLPQTFDPLTIESLTLDSLIAQNIGVIAATSSIQANKSLKFVQTSISLPCPNIGREDSMPQDSTGPLYRVGVRGVSGVSLSDVDKLRLLLDNNSSYVVSLFPDDPRAVLTFDLSDSVAVNSIAFTSNKAYSVECFTTQWQPFVAGTVCSRIRVTLSASSTTGNLKVYTRDSSKVDSSVKVAAYAALVSNKSQTLPTPIIILDVTDWRAAGTARVSNSDVLAASCPSLVHLELKPKLLEV